MYTMCVLSVVNSTAEQRLETEFGAPLFPTVPIPAVHLDTS
jgi:hypothetical protein